MRLQGWLLLVAVVFTASGCDRITNSPHAKGAEKTNTFFTAFEERSPRYLDPTASYAIDETPYTYSVYEPLYRFHYLKRPYEIVPRTAEAVAVPRFFDKAGQELPADARGEDIAEAVYDIKIKRGIRSIRGQSWQGAAAQCAWPGHRRSRVRHQD